MQIFIKNNMTNKLLTLDDMEHSDTIDAVKRKIQSKEGRTYLTTHFQLAAAGAGNGCYLEGERELWECNIQDGATLELYCLLSVPIPVLSYLNKNEVNNKKTKLRTVDETKGEDPHRNSNDLELSLKDIAQHVEVSKGKTLEDSLKEGQLFQIDDEDDEESFDDYDPEMHQSQIEDMFQKELFNLILPDPDDNSMDYDDDVNSKNDDDDDNLSNNNGTDYVDNDNSSSINDDVMEEEAAKLRFSILHDKMLDEAKVKLEEKRKQQEPPPPLLGPFFQENDNDKEEADDNKEGETNDNNNNNTDARGGGGYFNGIRSRLNRGGSIYNLVKSAAATTAKSVEAHLPNTSGHDRVDKTDDATKLKDNDNTETSNNEDDTNDNVCDKVDNDNNDENIDIVETDDNNDKEETDDNNDKEETDGNKEEKDDDNNNDTDARAGGYFNGIRSRLGNRGSSIYNIVMKSAAATTKSAEGHPTDNIEDDNDDKNDDATKLEGVHKDNKETSNNEDNSNDNDCHKLDNDDNDDNNDSSDKDDNDDNSDIVDSNDEIDLDDLNDDNDDDEEEKDNNNTAATTTYDRLLGAVRPKNILSTTSSSISSSSLLPSKLPSMKYLNMNFSEELGKDVPSRWSYSSGTTTSQENDPENTTRPQQEQQQPDDEKVVDVPEKSRTSSLVQGAKDLSARWSYSSGTTTSKENDPRNTTSSQQEQQQPDDEKVDVAPEKSHTSSLVQGAKNLSARWSYSSGTTTTSKESDPKTTTSPQQEQQQPDDEKVVDVPEKSHASSLVQGAKNLSARWYSSASKESVPKNTSNSSQQQQPDDEKVVIPEKSNSIVKGVLNKTWSWTAKKQQQATATCDKKLQNDPQEEGLDVSQEEEEVENEL